jgi:hypothetical protein
MDMHKKQLVAEALIDLHRRLNTLPTRSHERRNDHAGDRQFVRCVRTEEQSLYRALVSAKGASQGIAALRSWYTEGVAVRQDGAILRTHRRALKVRTSNKKGRHLSTGEAILAGEFASFADAVCTGKEPDVTGVDARWALAICFGIY